MPDSHQPNPMSWLDDSLSALDRVGLRRRLAERSSPQGPCITLSGQELVNFGSNDYLGLAADPRLVEAAVEAARKFGWGGGASPLVSGRATPHANLENRLAKFEQTEAAILFPSGFAANAGTIPALVSRGDAIYADAKNHASLIDGCRLAKAERFVYPHRGVDALAALLQESTCFRRRLIVTDSLFSMDGDLAPLVEVAQLAQKHDAMVLVDEAHATGVFGTTGRGVVEALAEEWPPLEKNIHVRVGTLSKAIGSAGGFVVGSRPLIDWLANRVRPYVFSTAAPPAVAAAASVAIDIIQNEPERRIDLLARARRLRTRLSEQGWRVGQSESQIVSVFIGESDATMQLAAELRQRGFFVPGIRPPTVPLGESLLRISLCWNHTEEAIDRLVDALAELRKNDEIRIRECRFADRISIM